MHSYVFQLRGHHRYLATNPKVLTRTLSAQPSLERVRNRRVLIHSLVKWPSASFPPRYALLARHPVSRVESFFRDKLRRQAHAALKLNSPYKLKLHQMIFYPWIGVTGDDPLHVQVSALLDLSFERFIELLPNVYMRDPHLRPQTTNYSSIVFGYKVRLHFNEVFKTEDVAAMARCSELFDLDLSIRRNVAEPDAESVKWTDSQRQMVAELYRDDMSQLGYTLAPPTSTAV